MKVFYDVDVEWERSDAAHFSGNLQVKRLVAISEGLAVKRSTRSSLHASPGPTGMHTMGSVQLLFVVE